MMVVEAKQQKCDDGGVGGGGGGGGSEGKHYNQTVVVEVDGKRWRCNGGGGGGGGIQLRYSQLISLQINCVGTNAVVGSMWSRCKADLGSIWGQ